MEVKFEGDEGRLVVVRRKVAEFSECRFACPLGMSAWFGMPCSRTKLHWGIGPLKQADGVAVTASDIALRPHTAGVYCRWGCQ